MGESAQCYQTQPAECATGFPHGHALKHTPITQTECGNPGVCVAIDGSGYSQTVTKTADATEEACCTNNGGTWGSTTPAATPATTTAAPTSGATSTRAVTGLLVATVALVASLA